VKVGTDGVFAAGLGANNLFTFSMSSAFTLIGFKEIYVLNGNGTSHHLE
jgi:hypothetical protein